MLKKRFHTKLKAISRFELGGYSSLILRKIILVRLCFCLMLIAKYEMKTLSMKTPYVETKHQS